ncbi:unnamed protein product [Auanema sp. JU1783]|nr:unnamed protein product [Auanema sp. JU1783]
MSSNASALSPIEQAKRAAALACFKNHIKSGDRIGVGSGSTVKYLVEHIKTGLESGTLKDIVCVPTSFLTRKWLMDAGIPLTDLEMTPELDVCIDGADEIDVNLTLIKGGGGCLAREKIVQFASKHFYVIADHTKESVKLGEHYSKIPIEVLPFAVQPLLRSIAKMEGGETSLRMATNVCAPALTDNNNYIIDWTFDKSKTYDWIGVHNRIINLPGVVETGLFFGVVKKAYLAFPDLTIKELEAKH